MVFSVFSQKKISQQTVKRPVSLSGIGLHSGQKSNLTILPAPANHGIVFKRIDLRVSPQSSKDCANIIPAQWYNVSNTQFCTVLSNEAGAEVYTIEHCMSALAAAGVDNAIITIDTPEVPIMDGSAQPFLLAIKKAGIKKQQRPSRFIKILKPIKVGGEHSWAVLAPWDNFVVDFYFDFGASAMTNRPSEQLSFNGDDFAQQIASARTFGFIEHQAIMQQKNLALGAGLSNAVIFAGDEVLNPEGLRYHDECVRHKVLDAIGDLYLAGAPIIGKFTGYRSGHSLNNHVLQELFQDNTAWRYENYNQTAEAEPLVSQLEKSPRLSYS